MGVSEQHTAPLSLPPHLHALESARHRFAPERTDPSCTWEREAAVLGGPGLGLGEETQERERGLKLQEYEI